MLTKKYETRFALTTRDRVVAAEKGKDLTGIPLFCLACGKEVRHYAAFTQGKRSQAAHFRHIHNESFPPCTSSSESYLHSLAKYRFYELYQKSEKFFVHYRAPAKCVQAQYPSCQKIIEKTIDLKSMYPHIVTEKRNGKFIPDCMIYNDDKKGIYIEVCHTSRASTQKISSGIPIIEIYVSTEETILEGITGAGINKKLPISFYNFGSVPANLSYDCAGACPHVAYPAPKKKYIPPHKRTSHPERSLETVFKFLNSRDHKRATEILDRMRDYYLKHAEFGYRSPVDFGWYRKVGKDGEFYYLKDQRYYLFWCNFEVYGIYHFGKWYGFKVVDGGVDFFAEKNEMEEIRLSLQPTKQI